MVRFQPLVAPVMHRMDVKVHYFYVPFRILWDGWEKFIQGKNHPITNLAPVHPTFSRLKLTKDSVTGTTLPKLADRFGFRYMPDSVGDEYQLNPMVLLLIKKFGITITAIKW